MRIEILEDGQVVNVIVASEEYAEANFPGAWRPAAEQEEPAPKPNRYISVGAFYDRFGAAKWSILADPDPMVQAVVKDSSVRKYIDLDREDLPAGLAVLQAAGHNIDPGAILGDPILDSELP